jgi:hypothetical protein
MSNLRGRIRRLERRARIHRRYAAIHAEIARQEKAQDRRVENWRRRQNSEPEHVV